jgi:hypothetical protein
MTLFEYRDYMELEKLHDNKCEIMTGKRIGRGN